MINPDDLQHMSPWEKQVLRDLSAIAFWSTVGAVGVLLVPIVITLLALAGY